VDEGDFPVGPGAEAFSGEEEGPLRRAVEGSRSGQASTPDRGAGEAGSDLTEGGQESPSTGSGRTEGDPTSRRAAIEGEERICASRHRELQITRAGERKLFDKKARKAFLEWYAATGNVVWSAEKVGFADKTVWKHRMNDPRFAEAFDRAFEQSVVRNKARMLERKAKEKPIGIDGGVGESELGDCDLEKAWPLIVEIERAKGRGGGGGGAPVGRPRKAGRAPRVASNAEVREALEKRLCAFGRRIRAQGGEPPPWLPPVEPGKSARKVTVTSDCHSGRSDSRS
jgi:hypothetical protein